jgi:carbon monoxide dehydrogenase subunit G
MHVERTFHLDRPVEEVFAYLSDFTTTNEWDPGTVETERTSGDGGLGTTYRNTSQFLGRRVALTYTTITFQPPHRVQFRGRNGGAVTTDSMTFTPEDGGTQVHYRADFRFGPLLSRLAPLLLRRPLDRLADETVAEIHRVLAPR